MVTINRILPQLRIWLLALLVVSCQADLVDAPDQSLSKGGSETEITATQDAELQAGGPGAVPQVCFRRLLGRVTALVTPLNGGTLSIQSSRLVIPPYAVVAPTLVTWELRVESPEDLTEPLNRIYEFWPDGLVFLVPITLDVSFTDAGLGGRDPNQYRCYYYNELSQSWEPQPTTVDVANRRFVVTLNHFSRYAFGR